MLSQKYHEWMSVLVFPKCKINKIYYNDKEILGFFSCYLIVWSKQPSFNQMTLTFGVAMKIYVTKVGQKR